MDPVLDPASPAQKPGYKTTEFYLAFAALLVGILLQSDLFPADGGLAKALGIAASVLGVLGYQVGRTLVKMSGNKAAAFVEAAKVSATNPSKVSG